MNRMIVSAAIALAWPACTADSPMSVESEVEVVAASAALQSILEVGDTFSWVAPEVGGSTLDQRGPLELQIGISSGGAEAFVTVTNHGGQGSIFVDVDMEPMAADWYVYPQSWRNFELKEGAVDSFRIPRPEIAPFLTLNATMKVTDIKKVEQEKWYWVNYTCLCSNVELLAHDCWPKSIADGGGLGDGGCNLFCFEHLGIDETNGFIMTRAANGTQTECTKNSPPGKGHK